MVSENQFMSDDTPSSNETIPFRITFSTDRKGFFRRTCPDCGRDFKTEVHPADFVSTLQPVFDRLEADIGERLEIAGNGDAKEFLYCPYCEHHAESADMLTDSFIAYFKRWIMREYVVPKLNKALEEMAEEFQRHNRSNPRGMFSINLTFTHEQSPLPVRPIDGPDIPDMTVVELLCCGRKVKIDDGWLALKRCPYCGTEITL